MMTIRPLPAHSQALRQHRFEVDILGRKNARGARPAIATGRFVSYEDAKEWADHEHPDAEHVNVTLYAARRGWQSQHAGRRVHGTWTA